MLLPGCNMHFAHFLMSSTSLKTSAFTFESSSNQPRVKSSVLPSADFWRNVGQGISQVAATDQALKHG
jgi:hypothetical protein